MRVSRKYLLAIIAIMTLGCLSIAEAAQVALEYVGTPRTFKVCALYVSPASANAHPLIFEGLRRCPDKPAGWDFENPLAGLSGSMLPNKATAAYWAVDLTDENASRLIGLDLIYICQADIAITSQRQREALIKAARTGTIIWVDQYNVDGPDTSGAAGTVVTAFAPPGDADATDTAFTFSSNGAGNVRTSYGGNSHAWLLQNPCKISSSEIGYIGRYPRPGGTEPSCDGVEVAGGGSPFLGCQPVLVDDDGTAYYSATITPYGAGAIVITAGEVGYDLEDWWANTGNWWNADQLRRPSRYQLADFKFAYNIFGATSRWSQTRRSPSGAAKSLLEVRPPLEIAWQFPGRFQSLADNKIGPVVGGPVCADGRVFAVTLASPDIAGEGAINSYLLCFDADPAQDLDGDGTVDDGILDYSAGAPYDMVWAVDLGDDRSPRASSPCVADVYGVSGAGGWAPQQVVLVSLVDPTGSDDAEVHCYSANTGADLWSYTVAGYNDDAEVVALSTPVVYQDYVYVLASEFDDGLDGDSVKSTYGRAHCFKLSYDWNADQDGPQWVFPSFPAMANRDAELQGVLPPFQEPQWVAGIDPYDPRPLLPPAPGAVPVLSGQDVLGPNEREYDTVLNFGTPVSTEFTGPTMSILGFGGLLDRSGGCFFGLIPTPNEVGSTDDQLNATYFRMRLAAGRAGFSSGTTRRTSISSIERVDDSGISIAPGSVQWADVDTNNDGDVNDACDAVYIWLTGTQARQLLLPSTSYSGGADTLPHNIALGATIELTYSVDTDDDGAADDIVDYKDQQFLGGPVLYRFEESQRNRRCMTSPVIVGPDSMIVASDAAEDPADRTVDAAGGSVRSLNRTSGKIQDWEFRPKTTLSNLAALPDPDDYAALCTSAAAVDAATETAYVAANHAQTDAAIAEVLGIGTEADISIKLRPEVGSTKYPEARIVPGSVAITTLNADYTAAVSIAASTGAYEIDYESPTITFRRSLAGWVNGSIGSLYGKPVWVSYQFRDPADPDDILTPDTDPELHILPDLVRFQYLPGFIRLRHNFVNPDSISVSLPNGRSVVAASWGDGEEQFAGGGGTPLPSGWSGMLPRGLMDVSALALTTEQAANMPLQPGCNIQVSYSYYDEGTGAVETVAGEIHQIPCNFGESVSSPAVGGRVLHIGTEGLDANRNGALESPEIDNSAHAQKPFLVAGRMRETLLSLFWDPIRDLLRGYMAQPAIPEASSYAGLGIPAVSSSPAIGDGRVYVGSNMTTAIATSENVGFVSALKPQSTFICDDTRIVEVVGDTPVWVCHGTLSTQFNERLNASRGTDERLAIPFNRPAKAAALSNGNLLVVDTGNNRVVEIDRQGVVKWPLNAYGADFYTSPTGSAVDENNNRLLQLDSPSDAFRYYTITDSGTAYNSTNGALLGSTTMHTVIADAGNGRVIDVVTWLDAGQQRHEVFVRTPTHVKAAGGTAPLQSVAYTAVRPIFDPSNTAVGGVVHPVIGYLCAASNLHQLVMVTTNAAGVPIINPASDNEPVGGTGGSTWAWLAWLWDADLADGVYGPANPLIFRNIRDVQTSYEGDYFYITVTCGQYMGRLSDVQANNPHRLAGQGDGVFEFCCHIPPATPASWALDPAINEAGNDDPDTPIWYMIRADYTYCYLSIGSVREYDGSPGQVFRDLSSIYYQDVDGTYYRQTLPWFPVSAKRLPCDSRPLGEARYWRHLICNHAGLVPNLTRDNVVDLDISAPASLYSSVMVIQTDDRNDNYPVNDRLDIDQRLVIPNPYEPDWTDPLAQPTHASR